MSTKSKVLLYIQDSKIEENVNLVTKREREFIREPNVS